MGKEQQFFLAISMTAPAASSALAAADDDDDTTSAQQHKRARKAHHSADYRALVRQLCGGESPIVSAHNLSSLPDAPTARTIQRWLHDDDDSSDSSERRGRPFSLSDEQLLVLTGFLLFVLQHHRTVDARVILDFVSVAFNGTHNKSWVTKLLPRIGFSHHRATSLPVAYAVHDTFGIAVDWLSRNQPAILRARDSGHLVAMDQIAFWDNALITSCYAPVGGYALGRKKIRSVFFATTLRHTNFSLSLRGQPRTLTSTLGSKHTVYTAFCSDGACLPLVIFTGKAVCAADAHPFHTDGNPEHKAYVVRLPDIKQSSTETTEIWLEHMCTQVAEYLPRDSSVLMDVATWHVSEKMQAIWHLRGINTFFLPAASGRWLNPCDQSIHREMRRAFVQLQQRNPKNKLNNIISAYYAVTAQQAAIRGTTRGC